MISYNLDSLARALDLVDVCEKYKDDFDIHVRYGGQIVNGDSVLGVMSLCGNVVGVEVLNKKSDKRSEKYNDFLREIGAKK